MSLAPVTPPAAPDTAPGPRVLARPRLSGARATLLSAGLHLALGLAVFAWCRSASDARSPGRAEDAPPLRLLTVLPAEMRPDTEAPTEAEPEELPPAPAALPEDEPEPLAEIALVPEAPAPEASGVGPPAAVTPPAALPPNRRLRPRAPVPAPTPARSAPLAAPASRAPASRALQPRLTPTPPWPADLPRGVEARVGLLFLVGRDGRLSDVRVEQPSGMAALDEHVRDFVGRSWSFEPPQEPRWARQSFRLGR